MSEAAALPTSSSRPHAVKRNVLATWIAHAISLVVGFFLMPYVLGTLGAHQYGTWVFINSFVSYSGVLYLGMGETISRFVAKYEAEGRPDRVNEVASLVMVIYGCTGGLALVLTGLLCWLIPMFGDWTADELTQLRIVILLLGVNLFVSLCGSVCGGVLIGLRRFDLERGVTLVFDFVRFGLIFLFLSEQWGLVTIAAIYLFVTLGEQISYAVLAFRNYPSLRFRWADVKWSVFEECRGFSAMTLVSNLAYSTINSADSLVIGFMLGAEAIVPYYIGLRLTQFIRQPIDKIAHICMPTAGALAVGNDPRRLTNFLATALGVVVLLIGGMFIGGWFFGGDLIRVWIGEGYSQSHHILCILLGAQLIALPGSLFRAFLFGAGHARMPGAIYLAEAVCNLICSMVFCHFWGIVGVAWGTLLTALVFELGLLIPLGMKTLKISPTTLWDRAILPQLVPLAALAAFSWIASQQTWSHSGWPALIGNTLAGGAVLGAAWLLAHKLADAGD